MSAIFSAVLFLLTLLTFEAVPANPFPNIGLVLADNASHTFFITSTFSSPAVATYAMSNLDKTTDMWDVSSPSCTSITDVCWWAEDLPAGDRGRWTCLSYNIDGECGSADIDLDFAEIDAGPNDWYDRRKTAVHELGHTIGLGHDAISAMIVGEVPSTLVQWRRYSVHDLGHINASY